MILVPTRELAMQVHEQYEKLRERKSVPAALVIGGMSEQRQIQAIRKGADVVVATPGRLEDYLRRKLVNLQHVKILVLDESDRMLDMGFLPAIRRIAAALAAPAPDAVLLGHFGGFGGPPGKRLHEQAAAGGRLVPFPSRPTRSSYRPSKCRK